MMLQHPYPPTEFTSFLVIVEKALDVSDEAISMKLSGALTWVEGIGDVDVVSKGPYVVTQAGLNALLIKDGRLGTD